MTWWMESAAEILSLFLFLLVMMLLSPFLYLLLYSSLILFLSFPSFLVKHSQSVRWSSNRCRYKTNRTPPIINSNTQFYALLLLILFHQPNSYSLQTALSTTKYKVLARVWRADEWVTESEVTKFTGSSPRIYVRIAARYAIKCNNPSLDQKQMNRLPRSFHWARIMQLSI